MSKRIITSTEESMFDGILNVNSTNIRVYPAQYNRECSTSNLFAVLIANDNKFEGI